MTNNNRNAPTTIAVAELQSVISLKRARYNQLRDELDALGPELCRYESALRRARGGLIINIGAPGFGDARPAYPRSPSEVDRERL